MLFKYQTGEEILKGDRVTYHGEPGEIEFVVTKLTGDPAEDWYLQEFGGGVMVLEPKAFGRVFLSRTEDFWDLSFMARA
jgi:hypothetical protein